MFKVYVLLLAILPGVAVAQSPYFPIVPSSSDLVLCKRGATADVYGLSAFYHIEGARLRSKKLSSLSHTKARDLKNKCRRGDNSGIGNIGSSQVACILADVNHDSIVDRNDLRLLSAARRFPNLAGKSKFDRGDLIAIRSCWESVRSTPTPDFGLRARTEISDLHIPLDDPGRIGASRDVRLVRAFPNLTFSQPLFITSARDESNRLFVVEKPGVIRVFNNDDTVVASRVFLDISNKVDQSDEQGLLGLAFDPHFALNGYFYVYYNPAAGARRSVIARYHVTSDPNFADVNSESVVIEVGQPYSGFHKGGMIAFGPDGMLYIALGDGGQSQSGQDCTDLLGNMLRIDPHGAAPYAVPPDNPFAGSGNHHCGNLAAAPSRNCGLSGYRSGQICAEIWASGLRNPWRFSFDRVTGANWTADVGQGAWEEIDLVHRGDNLGWDIFEGRHELNNPGNVSPTDYTSPVWEYSHDIAYAGSVTGGYVYRGHNIPRLTGKYIYGDFVSGRIWALTAEGEIATENVELDQIPWLSSFGEDETGELFALDLVDGMIYRFEASSGSTTTPIPTHLSETGLFADVAHLQPVAGAIPYDVNAPLWSDGSGKQRWLMLPGHQTIGFDAFTAYDFPIGTAIVKQFDLPVTASTGRHVETRVLFHHNQGWVGYSYRWNAEQTDAILLAQGGSDTFMVQDGAGSRLQTWTYPSRSDCFSCHTSPSGTILGIRTRQLNRDYNYAGVTDNQLRSWNNIGLFGPDIGAVANYESYPRYSDSSKTLAKRARAYLAANCSHCHQPAVPGPGDLDLRFDTPISSSNVINIPANYSLPGLPNPMRIRPGEKQSSALWDRMRRQDRYRMPPLASSEVDHEGLELIGAWIDSGAED